MSDKLGQSVDPGGKRAKQEKLDEKRLLAEQQLQTDYEEVFATGPGMRVLRDLMVDKVNVINDAMTGNSRTFYHLGNQAVGRYLFQRCYKLLTPDFLAAMAQRSLGNQKKEINP